MHVYYVHSDRAGTIECRPHIPRSLNTFFSFFGIAHQYEALQMQMMWDREFSEKWPSCTGLTTINYLNGLVLFEIFTHFQCQCPYSDFVICFCIFYFVLNCNWRLSQISLLPILKGFVQIGGANKLMTDALSVTLPAITKTHTNTL